MHSNGCLLLSGQILIWTEDLCDRIRVEEADKKRLPTYHELEEPPRVAFTDRWRRGLCATAREYELWP